MTPQQMLMLQMMTGQNQPEGTPPPWMAGAPAGMGGGPQVNPLLMNALMTKMGGMDPAMASMMMTPQQQGQGINPMLWAMMMSRYNPQLQMTGGAGMGQQ